MKRINTRVNTTLKYFPCLDFEIARQFTDWCNSECISATSELSAIQRWMSYSGVDLETFTLDELKFYAIRKKIRRELLVAAGKRPDVSDITLAEVYYPDKEDASRVYAAYCKSKTKKMIYTVNQSPHLRASGTYASCLRKCNGDEVAAKKKYDEMCDKKGAQLRVQHFIDQGHSLEEATRLLRERQRTFSLDLCIARYGQELGHQVWQNRQDSWQETLKSKPQEEIELINKKKSNASIESYILRGYSEEEALKMIDEYYAKMVRLGFSKESIAFFKTFIPDHIFNAARHSEREWFLRDDTRAYFYDFAYNGVIIEYHGEAFHPNPAMSADEWASWRHAKVQSSADECYAHDQKKKMIAIRNGFKFHEVYSNDSEEVKVNKINQILFDLFNSRNRS